jgi:hypothetical protein
MGLRLNAIREPRKWPAWDEDADGCIGAGGAVLQGFAARRRDRGVMGVGIGCAVRVMKIPPRCDAIEVRAINLIDFN